MKVRLKVTHTAAEPHSRWKTEVEGGLELHAVQETAQTLREEVYLFDADTRAEAENLKATIKRWASGDPLSLLTTEGWLRYDVEMMEEE